MFLKKVSKIFSLLLIGLMVENAANADELVVLSYDIPMSDEEQDVLYKYCNDYTVPYEIALGVIETESTFDPYAVNWNGTCYGYMQINLCNEGWLYEDIEVDNITEPVQNIKSGIYMLSELYNKYEDWHVALVCYNCGEPEAKRYYFNNGIYSSSYSVAVMEKADKWGKIIYE